MSKIDRSKIDPDLFNKVFEGDVEMFNRIVQEYDFQMTWEETSLEDLLGMEWPDPAWVWSTDPAAHIFHRMMRKETKIYRKKYPDGDASFPGELSYLIRPVTRCHRAQYVHWKIGPRPPEDYDCCSQCYTG